MSKNYKLKKVIKSFVPEGISCFFGFLYAYEHYERFKHVKILVVFLDLYVTYSPRQKTQRKIPSHSLN